jgi:hypothetical protein
MVSGIGIAGVITVATRMNFAVQHLMAAARFSRAVKAVEAAHAGEQFGDFWDEILHNSVACVFACVASLEGYANELFDDRANVFPGYANDLLDKLWETFEQKPILEKFQFALLLKGKPELDRGAQPFQCASAMIDLRNALTHFKPEWTNEAVRHRKLSQRLNGMFVPSAFLSDELVFPRRWATHGCTKWSIESVRSFAEQFELNAGLPSKYTRPEWNQKLSP